MSGRVKHSAHAHLHNPSHMKPRPHLSLHRRQDAPPPPPPDGASLFDAANNSKGITLNKQTIIWLTVVSVIVVATLITVFILLCKCKRRKKNVKRHSNGHRWHPSMEVKDGRNEFGTWNRNAMPRGMRDQGVRLDTFESERDASPMKPAAVRPTGPAVMEPVVVDYADVNAPRASAKNSRYYSKQGRQSWWKRVSQIGRAY